MKCIICNEKIISSLTDQGAWGFNPAPISDKGRCCYDCDSSVVFMERLKRYGDNNGK